jgi:hypothetical protein
VRPLDTRSILLATSLLVAACAPPRPTEQPAAAAPAADPFLDTLEERTFSFFWDSASRVNGLVPDRWPGVSFSSIAAVGFGLTAYPVGVERGYVTREQARERTLVTLRFFWSAPQGPAATGMTGHRGFFYHFLDMDRGHRWAADVELSTIDTALLIAGVLAAAEYFDGAHPDEQEIRRLADALYRRVEWDWFQRESPLVTMGWRPESQYIPARYEGYDEAMLLYVLALGSPTHPIRAEAWPEFTRTYAWGEFYGQEHLNFAPLFGHQYSHIWIDTRGIQDEYMRGKGIDYFENSRRATLSQRAYAIDNPMRWKGYDGDVWGLTASSGPTDATHTIDGVERTFHTYWARGAAMKDIRDDGTIAPTAVGGSIPFAPEETIAALKAMRDRYGEHVFRSHGFVDAFNPTLDREIPLKQGRVVPGVGWFEDDYLGIDQGPIVLMLENHRSGLIWRLMKKNPHVVRGLCRAGFTGGWLEGRCRP